jgi:hypothetical protein
VPSGATVTSVRISAWKKKLVARTAHLTAHSIKIRVVGSGGTAVHSTAAADLISNSPATGAADASYLAQSAGSAVAVNAGSQASTTDVRIEFEYSCTQSNAGSGANTDFRVDDVVLAITYTPSVGGPAATLRARSYPRGINRGLVRGVA